MDGQEKCQGMEPMVCCLGEKTISPSGKINHCTRDASAYLWYILGTYSTSTTTFFFYFHHHFHTYSITCSKELTTYPCYYLYLLATDRIHLWIFDTPLSSATTGSVHHNCAIIYASSLVCCARVVAAMSPLQGV